jgi:diadenylate cyclase
MTDSPRFDREFTRAALSLGSKAEVDHFLLISDDLLPPEELKGKAVRNKLIYAVTSEVIAKEARERKHRAVVIPSYDYSRSERVRVALLSLSGLAGIEENALVLCLAGGTGQVPDTLMYRRIRTGTEAGRDVERLGLVDPFASQVMDTLIQLGLEISSEGFEGHPIGTIFTIGDHNAVMEKSRQMTINPFQGMSEAERNILDPNIRDAVKNFSVLDGAFVIREDGVVLSAGRYLSSVSEGVDVQLGLGARHAAAAAISSLTECLALTVSQTSGKVRVYKGGKQLLELGGVGRRRSNPERLTALAMPVAGATKDRTGG